MAEWVLSFESPKAVYESGVTGFHLRRELRALGVDRVVGAVSKMIKPAADRKRKTDRLDAQFLAKQLAIGEVAEVHVPDEGCEAARDLSRALADARNDVCAAKQRLSKFLLWHGFCYPRKDKSGKPLGTWTRAQRKWIDSCGRSIFLAILFLLRLGGLWFIWSFVSVTVSTVAGLLGCELRVRKHARR